MVCITFVIGFIITIAEPDLTVLAHQVPGIPDNTLIWTVAAGVGFFLVMALLRILFHWNLKYLLMGIIRIYKKIISPLFPPCCKYYPTCSSYALDAVGKFGFIRGGWLALWRVLRCNPWSMGGVDYVPEKFDILGRHNKKSKRKEK